MTNNYGQPQPPFGYGYAIARPSARNTQPLTPEQIARLRNNGEAFSIQVDENDLLASACTHKENGVSRLTSYKDEHGNVIWTCDICHRSFMMPAYTPEDVQNTVDSMINLLQTAKTIYLDAPEELVVKYFQLIPLLEKFPKIWNASVKNFSRYEGIEGVNPINRPGYSGFDAIGALITNPWGNQWNVPQQMPGYNMYPGYQAGPGYPAAPQPTQYQYDMYGNPVPVYGGQPGYVQQNQYVQQPGTAYQQNPVAYGAPQNVPPQAPTPMPTAPQQAAPAAGVVPPATGEVTQQKVFDV